MQQTSEFTTFKPEQITLSDNDHATNTRRIKIDAGIDLSRVTMAAAYRDNKSLMLNHLRGGSFKTHTRICLIPGTTEHKVIASKEIPAGTILGFYYGTVLTLENTTPANKDRSKGIVFFIPKTNGKIWKSFEIFGKLDGSFTPAAMMNHAYSLNELKKRYLFNDRATNLIGAENIIGELFQITFTNNGQSMPIEVYGLITKEKIPVGHALLWSYDKLNASLLPGNYWLTRTQMPLLFDKKGDFLDTSLYLPKIFFRTDLKGLYFYYKKLPNVLQNNPELKNKLQFSSFSETFLKECIQNENNSSRMKRAAIALATLLLTYLLWELAKSHRRTHHFFSENKNTDFIFRSIWMLSALFLVDKLFNRDEVYTQPQALLKKHL